MGACPSSALAHGLRGTQSRLPHCVIALRRASRRTQRHLQERTPHVAAARPPSGRDARRTQSLPGRRTSLAQILNRSPDGSRQPPPLREDRRSRRRGQAAIRTRRRRPPAERPRTRIRRREIRTRERRHRKIPTRYAQPQSRSDEESPEPVLGNVTRAKSAGLQGGCHFGGSAIPPIGVAQRCRIAQTTG